MKHGRKKKLALGLAAVILANTFSLCPTAPLSAYTAKAAPYLSADTVLLDEAVFFTEAADGLSGANSHTAKLRSSFAGNRLTGNSKKIYDILKTEIAKVAGGERTSTHFSIPFKDFLGQLKYTEEELGVTLYDPATQRMIPQEELVKISNQFISQQIITVEKLHILFSALLADCPYELYWYSKGAEESYRVSTSGIQIRHDGNHGVCLFFDDAALTFSFIVDAAYGADYETDPLKISATRTAAANADEIVREAANLTDYQKLQYYRQKICELVSYDHNAAASRSPGDQNPWQLIYVFDKDSRTNAVCEGYAKAFQYLCDMTAFEDEDIYSYTAYGTMSDGTVAGPHMWNIVHMGDLGNYLADLTNSDEGTPGADGSLFLTGYASQISADSYSFTASSRPFFYQYNADTAKIYPAEALALVNGGRLKESDMHVHSWTVSQVIEATCTAQGRNLYSCTICGKSKSEETAASGHAYEVSYTWSENDKTCTAAITCKNDRSHTAAPQEAGLEDETVTMDIRGADGSLKYKLNLNTQDLSAGNSLSIYRLDAKTGEYLMVDDKPYTVTAEGCLRVTAPVGTDRIYQLVNVAEADKISQAILKTVAMERTSASVRKGKSIKASLSSHLNMENVKSIAYTSSKKAVAKVSAKGTVTAKKAGTAVIKAKVVLKNGLSRTVSMKVKVIRA